MTFSLYLIINQKGAQASRELRVVGSSFLLPKSSFDGGSQGAQEIGKFKKLTLLSFNLTTDLQWNIENIHNMIDT